MTTRKFLKGMLLIIMTVTLFSFDSPNAWFKRGDSPDKYEMGIDKGAGQDGKNAATIKSIDEKIDGFGTLMQDCLPDKFLGKRIRMTGMVRTNEVSDWAALWLRIDTKTPIKAVVFDNMHDGGKDRSIKGTTEWKKYAIVLDVPNNASIIMYGALLSGTGQIWFDNINFEIVAPEIPATGIEKETSITTYISHQKEPVNLDFEK